MARRVFFIALLGMFMARSAAAQSRQTGKWGDQGDGTYRNPILAADYSDPDPVRVGDDHYLIASTFEDSPGIAVLHSKDLVNWRSIGSVFKEMTAVGPDFGPDRMNRYGRGLYAPSLRHHNGQFYVFVNCISGEGFYCCTATNPAGPWTVTQIKDKHGKPLRTSGWTDPCPFWDDDGRAYLASSRPGKFWYGYLFQMTPDGSRLLDADVDAMNVKEAVYAYPNGGTLYSPFHSTEGNKLYKRNGYYYLLHIEFLQTGHGAGTYVLRSKHLYGTKKDGTPGKPGDCGEYDILKWGASARDGNALPGQGGLIDMPDGQWFFVGQFNRHASDGRNTNLVPVTWVDDWPVQGVNVDANRQGRMAWQWKKPMSGGAVTLPQGSDDFAAAVLDPKWSWNHKPRQGLWSLTERPGFMRLYASKPAGRGGFFKAANTLHQRHLRSNRTTATATLDLAGLADGQRAGLAHFNGGKNVALLAVVKTAGQARIVFEVDGKPTPGPVLPASVNVVHIRSVATFDDKLTFSFGTDGKTFTDAGQPYVLKGANFRGDRVGLFTYNDNGQSGYVDIDSFVYEADCN